MDSLALEKCIFVPLHSQQAETFTAPTESKLPNLAPNMQKSSGGTFSHSEIPIRYRKSSSLPPTPHNRWLKSLPFPKQFSNPTQTQNPLSEGNTSQFQMSPVLQRLTRTSQVNGGLKAIADGKVAVLMAGGQ